MGGGWVDVDDDSAAFVAELVDRGLVTPRYSSTHSSACTIVIPAYANTEQLAACLQSLGNGHPIIVVDDASPDGRSIRELCERYGARLLVHGENRGPATARNTGLSEVDTEFVAFIDSDCVGDVSWINTLGELMSDPRLAVVAPRVRHASRSGLIGEFEYTDSALDMGQEPNLVGPGTRLGFIPSAAMLARRSALGTEPFDPLLRTGEDVDAVWRLVDAGWIVRYEPSVVIHHAGRHRLRELMGRRTQYGRSSGQLSDRYPSRLVPARMSVSSVLLGAALVTRRPSLVAGAAVVAVARVRFRVRRLPDPVVLTAHLASTSLGSDAQALGSLLRREWWPVGAACLALAPRSHLARVGAVLMVAPVLRDWRLRRSSLDPVTYVGLRLMADAAYGTGVIAAAATRGNPGVLTPRVRWTTSRRRPIGRWK